MNESNIPYFITQIEPVDDSLGLVTDELAGKLDLAR